jgi:hypothetical protein
MLLDVVACTSLPILARGAPGGKLGSLVTKTGPLAMRGPAPMERTFNLSVCILGSSLRRFPWPLQESP